jgi:subtilase family serine protease
LLLAAAAVGAAALVAPSATAAPSASGQAHRAARVCAAAHDGVSAACAALIRTDAAPQPNATTAPSGYGPSQLQSAYNLTTAAASNGAGKIIAIVDAYHDPTAISDVNTYRTQYQIPTLATCNGTTIHSSPVPCIAQVNQTGGTSYPRVDGGWAQEISLDLDMASAICPKCSLLLVEASSNSFANLGTAVNYAAANAFAVSNSYGGSDTSDTNYGKYYNHPGVAITVSSGDAGYGAEYPASSQYVTAVGGTSLRSGGGSRGWTETAWSGAGSGCSAYNTKPSWQNLATTSCSRRAVADVSAVADPNTGVAVYDSTKYQGRAGWMVFGGTSASAPIIAGVYALAGSSNGDPASRPWNNQGALFDVTSGSNGSCSTAIWCKAGASWDGPTGLGTPNGTGAF